jgi:hypothetical protein
MTCSVFSKNLDAMQDGKAEQISMGFRIQDSGFRIGLSIMAHLKS